MVNIYYKIMVALAAKLDLEKVTWASGMVNTPTTS